MFISSALATGRGRCYVTKSRLSYPTSSKYQSLTVYTIPLGLASIRLMRLATCTHNTGTCSANNPVNVAQTPLSIGHAVTAVEHIQGVDANSILDPLHLTEAEDIRTSFRNRIAGYCLSLPSRSLNRLERHSL